jgi:hypothetical protein
VMWFVALLHNAGVERKGRNAREKLLSGSISTCGYDRVVFFCRDLARPGKTFTLCVTLQDTHVTQDHRHMLVPFEGINHLLGHYSP